MKLATHMLLFVVLLATPAFALSPKNRDLVQKHIESKGKITYAIYAPPLGADTGVAVIETSAGTRLYAARLAPKGGVEMALDESFSMPKDRPPFLLLAGGRHILTYDAPVSASGTPAAGDLRIRDLTAAPGSKPLFELKGVAGLNFQAAEDREGGALLWQPLQHFLNTPDMLPIKYVYFALRPAGGGGTYQLRHHLEVLEGNEEDEGVRLNNYGVLLYRIGGLKRSADAFDQAAIFVTYDQSRVLRNHQFVSREAYQLSQQRENKSGLPFSEARMYYWQGDFAACLSALSGSDPNGMPPSDLAMLTIALAQENRWPESDAYLPGLARTSREFYANCLGELAWVAWYQGHDDIMVRYLKALEQIDNSHPALVTALATLTVRSGDKDGGRRLLDQYLAGQRSSNYDLALPRLKLFGLCFERGDQAGSNALLDAAAKPPLGDLASYVDMLDYTNFSLALRAGEEEKSKEAIEGPPIPLDSLGFQEDLTGAMP